MTHFKLIIFATLLLTQYLNAQTVQQVTAPKLGTVDIKAHKEVWNANLQNMEMPSPDGTSEQAKLLQQKAIQAGQYPRKFTPSKHQVNTPKSLGSNVFASANGMEGNAYNNRVPNDNTLAISNDGILVSCINSKYRFYDTEADTLMDEGFLNDFIASYNISQNKYDPKMTYDPNEDRFILTFLIGNYWQNSKIAVCFSTTNNPMDDWNVYLLTGDALGSNHWTDYPAVAVNESEFFLTGNLLYNDSSWQTGFYQSIIWQIDKFSGYNGDSLLTMNIWSDIYDDTIKIRNIHPVKGARNLLGQKQHFVSTKNFSMEGDTVYLLSIDNTIASGTAQMDITRLSTPDHYFLAPNAKQSIAKELATNDSRVLGAISDGDWIQYVHNSLDTATGTCSVYHGFIDNISTSPTISGRILSDTVMDLGYPNIASTSDAFNDKQVVIGFNFTSPVDTNGIACYYMDNNEDYSDIIKVKVGDQPISRLSSSPDRWGDYFGIQRKFNEPCEVWLGGMYGGVNKNGSWLTEVRTSNACFENFAGVESHKKPSNALVYPNPAKTSSTISFELQQTGPITISIIDANGKVIGNIYEDVAKKGLNQISFFVDHLPTGWYVVSVTGINERIVKKLVIE
jgi:hypothetical protein